MPGATYGVDRNELDGHNNASAMLIDLVMMTAEQAQSLVGTSAYAGYALYVAIASGSGTASGVAQVTIKDLDRD